MTNFTHVFQAYTSEDGRNWFAADSSDSYPRLTQLARLRSEQHGHYERVMNLEIGETVAAFQAGREIRLPMPAAQVAQSVQRSIAAHG